MITVTEYKLDSGELGTRYSYSSQEGFDLNQKDGFGYLDGHYSSLTHYVVNGQPIERTLSPVTINGRTLSDVPAGSTLWIDGESYEAEGDVELDFVMPGTYKLRVVCFPYREWEYDLVML